MDNFFDYALNAVQEIFPTETIIIPREIRELRSKVRSVGLTEESTNKIVPGQRWGSSNGKLEEIR